MYCFLTRTAAVTAGIFIISGALTSTTQAGGLAAGAKVSSQGIGLEVTGSLTTHLNARVSAHYFEFDKTIGKSGNDYDFDLKLKSFNALLDWHVAGGGFRVSGGLVVDKNSLDGAAVEANSYDIGGTTYTSSEVGRLTGNVHFRDVSPYVGIGWGNPVGGDGGWTFMADLGVVFTGAARVDLQSTGGSLSDNAAFLAEVAQEEQDVRDDLDGYKFYPVISLGLSYKF